MSRSSETRQQTGGKLTDILLRNNAVAPEALQTAETESKEAGQRLERWLIEKNLVPSAEMTLAMAEYLQMAPMSLAHFKPDNALIETVPHGLMTRYQVVPLVQTGKSLTVAMADPFNIVAIDELHTATGLDIVPVVAAEKEVRNILEKNLADEASSIDMEDIMKEAEGAVEFSAQSQDEGDKQSLEEMMESATDTPVIRMVNMIMIEAMRLKANDIHIEPQEDYVRLRFRVDGVLLERPHLHKSLHLPIVSRIKIMSDLDIGEQRLPQDGRFRIQALGKKIDVRVSILPTIFGGKVVLRLLDKGALFPNLAALGLDAFAYKSMSYAIAQPHGIILVTGPTGSGKTTTLYSCLQEMNTPDINIVTCEDPVEYQVAGINQVKIVTDVGMTFASALRAILRQDPDVCLIGEIRDGETCEIAIKAALTGHIVLSTLHANDAAGAVTRLLNMGIEPFLIASSVILTQAQRLYRKLCVQCRKPEQPDKDLLDINRIPLDFFDNGTIYGPAGCPKCHNTGFVGRGSLMEVLLVDEHIRTLILRQAIASEIRERAIETGMKTLLQVGLERVKDGTTNLETALRVTGGGEA